MDNTNLKLVGQRVREIRKQLGFSQEQLGEIAGFHFSYIGGVERGQKNISMQNLEKIAEALGVQLHELFIYGRRIKRQTSEKELLLNEINEKLVTMKPTQLRKIQRLIDELIT